MMEYKNLAQNPKSNSTFLLELNTLMATLSANKSYLLVPTAYKPEQEGKFILTVSLDSDFCCTEICEPLLPNKQTAKGHFEKMLFNESFDPNKSIIEKS
mmetsp:Transcript_45785/g.33501  ORF Transcript_45785/g.33501 Transcript_45785/m.33501 type:complete len:99 (-) Transcript_45785:83-379(-)